MATKQEYQRAFEKLSFEQAARLVEKAFAIYFSTHPGDPTSEQTFKHLANARKVAGGSKAAYMGMIDDVPNHEIFYSMVVEEANKPGSVIVDPMKRREPPKTGNNMVMYLGLAAVAAIIFFRMSK